MSEIQIGKDGVSRMGAFQYIELVLDPENLKHLGTWVASVYITTRLLIHLFAYSRG